MLLVLVDLRGDFAEGAQHGRGLGVRQPGGLQGLGAPGMVQGRGRPSAPPPHRLGQAGGGRGASPAPGHLDRFEGICAMPAGAIEVFVQPLGVGAANAVTTKRG